MTVKPFAPKYMKLGVLTAALQELTPRDLRDKDPDRAIEDWLRFGREIGADNIQVSAALHPTESDVPPEAMLDPVANTLDLRQPFDRKRADRVAVAMKEARVGISDIAYFDNMLHHDAGLRKKKMDFMLRVFDTAALLGVDAVCGFVGRNQTLSMDQNLEQFAHDFVPLLKEAKARGLVYRVEQCPMPGWTTGDNFHNNIGYGPGPWIALHRICEKHGVGDQLRIHYDPSHSILMGRGDWRNGKPSANPADQSKAWLKQTILCEHELPGTARHDPLAYLQNRSVDWLDHQLAARELLPLDPAKTHLIVEHEYPRARIQDKERLKPILEGSLAFTRKIDEAAASMFALQNEVLAAQGIPVQGHGREPYRS